MASPLPARQLGFGGAAGGGPPVWRTRYWSMTVWIIVLTSAVSFVDLFLLGGLSQFGALSLDGVRRLFLWQIFTYQLLHAGPLHLVFNMMWLYLLGPIIESLLGRQRFVMLYVVSGLTGGAAFLLLQLSGVVDIDPRSPLVGASGSILGVMAAAVCVVPRLPVRFWFPPISIQLWVVFLIAVGLALLILRTSGDNAGGEAAHLGGAAAGLIAFKFRDKLNLPGTRKRSPFWKPGDPASNFFRDVR